MFQTNFHSVGDKETEQLLSKLLENSPNLVEISFGRISNEGLRHIAASNCTSALRTIQAEVKYSSLEAIKTICQACPNLRSLYLENDSSDLEGDEIIQAVVQYYPMIETMSTERWYLTDVSMDALAAIHTLKELEVCAFSALCSSQAV